MAALLYVIPPIVLLVARSRRDRALWELALDIPLAVALDLMGLMLLGRFMTMELAVLVSRPLWLIGGGIWTVRRKRRGELAWPRALGKREVGAVALTVLVSVVLSTTFSRNCLSFDRGWHIPLSTAIRGQTLPFSNVYGPGKPLAYHFAGDVLAAALQTLSGLYIHSSLALSLSHDLMFALAGATLALLLCWLGLDSPAPVAVLAQAPLLAGPATLLVSSHALGQGYNFITLYKLGFRPHTALALLFAVGFFAAVLVRMRERATPPPTLVTALVLIAMTGAMAVTDELSIGLLGLCLGATWLVFPDVIAEKRTHGIAVLVGLLAALVLASVVFHSTLVSGVGQPVAWVPARSPGYYRRPLSLATHTARIVLLRDVLPTLGIWLGACVALLRDRNRERVREIVFLTVLFGVSVLCLTHVDIGQRSVESHRFMTAALLLLPVGAFSWLFPLRPRIGLAETLTLAGMTLGAVSSLDWWAHESVRGAGQCTAPSMYFAQQDLLDVNCRKFVDAHFGQRPVPMYLDKPIAYAVAGCRPVYTSGPPPQAVRSDRLDLPVHRLVKQWDSKIGRMLFNKRALLDVNGNLTGPGQPLRMACAHPSYDPACRYAEQKHYCHSIGSVDLCLVPPGDRRATVERYR